MIKNKKVAFVCAIHQSETHRPNGFELFNDYLVSIYTSCKYPFKLFAFDNESDDKFEVENQPDSLVITRVDNQYKGGCTYTWNEGIKMAIKEDYDAVIITSDDQIYDESVNDFIDTILTHEHKDDAIFGPLSNNPNNDYQKAIQPNGKVWEISGKPTDELNGFCLAMTKESIQNNYFDLDGNFFNPGQEYVWGKQDVEVQKRVGHSIVVGSCYVEHKKQGGWREIISGLRR
jgi:GT2 family glycosyltransferase